MQVEVTKKDIARKLQAEINAIQGLGKPSVAVAKADFAPFNTAFPNRVFPKAAIHEFVSYEPADAAATSGFITALTGIFMKNGGICLWIGTQRKVFPPGLALFGLDPDRIIFVNPPKQKDLFWIIEEALKCEALTAVIGEIKELGFTESRRLQLAVERSGVTGFIHRYQPRAENAVACTTRWKINTLPAIAQDGLPGVGHNFWDIQLLKVRNGRPGSWQAGWMGGRFVRMAGREVAKPVVYERYA